jgi:hypothetical protein
VETLPPAKQQRRRAAYHAAAHCVVAYFLAGGESLPTVLCDSPGGFPTCCPREIPDLGMVDVDQPDGFAAVDAALTLCLAGPIGEAMCARDPETSYGDPTPACSSDWRKAFYLASGLSGDPTAYLDQVAGFLLKMLLDYWTAVETLAQAALDGGYLDASAVRSVLCAGRDGAR